VATPPSTPPSENSIHGDSSQEANSAAAATGLPMPTPAPGIVPSADPRIPVHEAPSEEIPPGEAPSGETSNGSHGTSAPVSAEEPGESPEPVTDGQHHSS
jgi:hypothetical protein